MHDWVAALGKLRAQSPALEAGLEQTVLVSDSTFAYVRTSAATGGACSTTGSLLIVVNRDRVNQVVTIPVGHSALQGCTSLAPVLGDVPDHSTQPVSGAPITLPLPPFGFAIYALH